MRTWIILAVLAASWDIAPIMTTAPLVVRLFFAIGFLVATFTAIAQDINELM